MKNIKRNKDSLSYLAKKNILNYINENNLKSGDPLPSENKLVEMMGVSRITIREALANLKNENIIYKIQGKGSFIKNKPIKLKNGLEVLQSPTQIMKNNGYTPHTEYLNTKIHLPEKEIKNKLQLEDDDKIVTYRRKRFADKKLVVYGIDSLPIKYFNGDVPNEFKQESMLNYVENQLKINIDYAFTEITPHQFDEKISSILNVDSKTIFMLLNQVHYNNKGKPIIYSLDYFNSDFFNFSIFRRRAK